jgi:DNA helicase-2/ATP-dependent DNA helicase PcrA
VAQKQQELRCPKCQGKLQRKKGKYGFFLGCENYPRCRAYVPLQAKESVEEKAFVASPYQQAIFDWAEKGQGHAVVEAVAGSGKTTTLVQLMRRLQEGKDVLFCAFNKHIATELSNRIPRGMQAATLHSIGWAGIRNWNPNVMLNPDKLGIIVQQNLETLEFPELKDKMRSDKTFEKMMAVARSALERIVSLVKSTMTNPADKAAVAQLVSTYQIEINGGFDLLFPRIEAILNDCKNDANVVDYDDMIWFPLVHPIPLRQYDWVLVDESQDLNRAQQELVHLLLRKNSRAVFVGDRRQAIYGFRGADTESMARLERRYNAKVLPLSVCYRCPTLHIEQAKEIVPQIEASPSAQRGLLTECFIDELSGRVEKGDLAVCRYNAPLVSPVMELIKNRIKAVIRGRDIGAGLLTLLKRLGANGISDLRLKLEDYVAKEIVKLAKKGRSVDQIQDKADTILALSAGCQTIAELVSVITEVFSDSTEAVVFSSIHKAKGLEADRVFFLLPDRCISKKAVTQQQQEQERNLKYVALTRAKTELVFAYQRQAE